MAQAVHDFRSLIDYLEFTGVDRIALTGMSLGGYTSALIACVDDRIQAVIPNVPVVSRTGLVDEWFPANMWWRWRSVSRAPTTNCPRRNDVPLAAELPPAGAQGPAADHRRARRPAGAPEQAELLWEHWDRCAFHWFPGNHILHVSQPDYLRRMTRFMSEFMFS